MENPESPETVMEPPRTRRRWVRRIAGTLIGLILLVALAPTIAQFGVFRNHLLALALPGLNGTITAEAASFGWLSPVYASDLTIRDANGATVLEIPEIQFTSTLWTLVTGGNDLGRLRLRDPRVNIAVDAKGETNLKQVFGNLRRSGNLMDRLQGRTLDIELVDLKIYMRTADSTGDWRAGNINFLGRIETAAGTDSPSPQLLIKPCKLLDRTELTPGFCNDVLRYVLPPLAGAAAPEGAVSIDLNDGAIPLIQPRKLTLGGAITIHDVAVGPGALTQSLTDLMATLQAPTRIQLADNSVVQFHIADERVEHSGLKFGVPQVNVRTEGTVGFDQTLDLEATVVLALGKDEKRPIITALGNQNLKVPIRGTFAEPKVELGALASESANWMKLMQTAGTLWSKRGGAKAGEATGTVAEAGDAPEAGASASDVLENLPIGNGEILNWWTERRKQRAEREAEAQKSAPPAETPAPRRRLFDRFRDREPTPPPPPAVQ